MKILKLLVQLECADSTRWFCDDAKLRRIVQTMLSSILHCWTDGPEPRITVIPEEKFFKDPDTAKPELNWQHVARVDGLIARGPKGE